jgi:hypothetical protein
MIVGRLQRQTDTEKLWDYSACYYPEGIIDPTDLFLFNHEQIEATYFIGFQDFEELEFQGLLISKYHELRKADSV